MRMRRWRGRRDKGTDGKGGLLFRRASPPRGCHGAPATWQDASPPATSGVGRRGIPQEPPACLQRLSAEASKRPETLKILGHRGPAGMQGQGALRRASLLLVVLIVVILLLRTRKGRSRRRSLDPSLNPPFGPRSLNHPLGPRSQSFLDPLTFDSRTSIFGCRTSNF